MDQLLNDNYFSDDIGQSVLSALNNLCFELDSLSGQTATEGVASTDGEFISLWPYQSLMLIHSF
jgi:hypothetical protein